MDDLVAQAGESIAKGSKSFAMASKLFDARTRERAWLLYAWCRHCDDMIDGQILGFGHIEPAADIDARLATMARLTKAALTGERTGIMPFDALARVAAETGLPERYPMELIAGFGMDAADRVYRSFDDTLDYCYHVAGVVGVMMAIAMGVPAGDRATLERASDLGIAFQLANIVRDVVDDDRLGRCYLPAEWLAEASIPPGEHAHPAYREALAQVVGRMVGEAERYEASARHGTPVLGFRAAWAVLSAAKIYGDIGRRVRTLGSRAWDRRVSTSRGEKLASVAVGLTQAVARARWRHSDGRDGLWTMAP